MLFIIAMIVGFALSAAFLNYLWGLFQAKSGFIRPILTFITCILFHSWYIYFYTPNFTHVLVGGYPTLFFVSCGISLLYACQGNKNSYGAESNCQIPYQGGILTGLLFVGWLIVTHLLVEPGLICDNPGKNKMAGMLGIQPLNDIPADTSPDTLLRVTPATAYLKASRAMSTKGNIGAYLEINKVTLQQLNGQWGYVVDFSVTNWAGFRAEGSMIPGYIWVSAADPLAEAELLTGFEMVYVPDARFNKDLYRHVYFNYLINDQWQVDDLTLEINDNGQPFYTASLLEHTVGWQGQRVVGVMTVDPLDGEIAVYQLAKGDIPTWIDRIYSLDWVEEYAAWWAKHHQYEECRFRGTAGQKQIDRVNDVLRHGELVYQVTLTSVGADQSLTDIVYINPKTGEARITDISGATLDGVESLVHEATYRRFTPEECELHQILGQPVWYCVLNGSGGSYAGVSFIQAKYSSEYTRVIQDATLMGGYDKLKQQIILDNPDLVDLQSEELPASFRWRGQLDRVKLWYGDNNGVGYIFSLLGRPPDSPDGPKMKWFLIAAGDMTAAFMELGDEIEVEAIPIENSSFNQVLHIWNYSYPPPE